MQSKVKLTKRQIKEDKFTTYMLEAKDRFTDNWQFWVIGAVIVILAVIAVSYYSTSQANKAVEAADKYGRAMMEYRNGQSQIAILSLNQIMEDYGSTAVAKKATFQLGVISYESKNYPEATRYFEQYLSSYRDNPLDRAAALAGIAASEENQGNFGAAAEKFDNAVAEYSDGPLVGDYLLGAMRSHLMNGDVASAQARLDKINSDFAGTDLARRAVRLFNERSSAKG